MLKKVLYSITGFLIGGVVLVFQLTAIPKDINENITSEPPSIDSSETEHYTPREYVNFDSYHIDLSKLTEYETNGSVSSKNKNPMFYQHNKEPETVAEDKGIKDEDKNDDLANDKGSTSIVIPDNKDFSNLEVELTKKPFSLGYSKSEKSVSFPDISVIEQLVSIQGVLPVDRDKYNVTSPFGMRRDPFTKEKVFHTGLDIAYSHKDGDNIYAVLPAKVEEMTTNENGLGNYIVLNHVTFKTVYGHFSAFKEGLAVGDEVNAGDVIGYMGTTGRSTGPHLHLEFQIDDICVDPELFMVQILNSKGDMNNAN